MDMNITSGIYANGLIPVKEGPDRALLLKFEEEVKINEAETRAQGKVVHQKIEFITIHPPGGRNITYRKITEHDKIRFAPQYNAWKKGASLEDVSGYPIDKWPQLSIEQIATLKYLKIYSIEALADAPDAAIQQIGMGGRDLQNKARTFLQLASGEAPFHALKNENEKVKEENLRLKAENDQIKKDLGAVYSRLEALEKTKPAAKEK